MRTYPYVLDAELAYLAGADRPGTLLFAPLGYGTVLDHVAAQLRRLTPAPPTVLTTFPPTPAYERALHDAGHRVAAVLPVEALSEQLASFPPTDRLLVIDAHCLPARPLCLDRILGDDEEQRWVSHLVALESTPAGTSEPVQVDARGCVQKIQRYYEEVNWPLAAGVVASAVPIASALTPALLSFKCLWELRQSLAALGVPSRDVSLCQPAFYLWQEAGLLGLNERVVLDGAAARTDTERAHPAHPAGDLAASACIVGPVVLQPGAVVEPGALIVGPAVLGARCRIGRGAIVAQSVIAAGLNVPPGTVIRQRVVSRVDEAPSPEQVLEPPWPAHFSPTSAVPALGPDVPANEERSAGVYVHVKRALDACAAALGLVALAPLLLLIAAAVKLDSRGPVFYGDTRETLGGRRFRCWKFRTMVTDADALQRGLLEENRVDGPQFKLDHDPRVTRLGLWLRATNLDELPQLLNVLTGEMSLVGPRPSPFRENQTCVPWRSGRLSVRPGITGLWQLCRHDRRLGDFHQWIYYDLLYVRHLSWLVDLKILTLTLLTLGGKASVPLSWLVRDRRTGEVRRGGRA